MDFALHHAAAAGNLDKCIQILSQHPEYIVVTDSNGWTPFHQAVLNGHQHIVTELLALSPRLIKAIDQRDSMGRTALHLAAMYGHERVVECLCIAKPELLLCVDNTNSTVLHWVLGEPFSRELIHSIWESNKEALRTANNFSQTPFDIAVSEDAAWAVEWLQWKLPLEEIVRSFNACDKPLSSIRPLINQALQPTLNEDVMTIVRQYVVVGL